MTQRAAAASDRIDATLDTEIRRAAARLEEAGIAAPEADAVALTAYVLGVEPGEVRRRAILRETVTADLSLRLGDLVGERARRIPLQHLTGMAHFRRLTLQVGPGVFIPRPETEVVAQAAIDATRRSAGAAGPQGAVCDAPLVVDLCTGSGAIALAIKDEVPQAQVVGVESDPLAYGWAVANRDQSGLDVELVEGDATIELPGLAALEGQVDVVVSNPPYIPTGMVPIDPEVRDHDPAAALYGGSDDGLRIPLAVAARAAALLRDGGLLVMEHADSQGELLPARLRTSGEWTDVADHPDLTGRPRFVTARRAPGRPGAP